MKKYLLIFFLCFSLFFPETFTLAKPPEINCAGLPGCVGADTSSPASISGNNSSIVKIIAKIISELIKYTSVIAVICVMIAGVMYLISGGEDEKIKKAKRWIIWSLVGVLVSVSSWFIVNLINNLYLF